MSNTAIVITETIEVLPNGSPYVRITPICTKRNLSMPEAYGIVAAFADDYDGMPGMSVEFDPLIPATLVRQNGSRTATLMFAAGIPRESAQA